MAFFSVIIPTLNEQKYLPNLLDSLSKQIDKDFEVLVVDGRSEDRTKEKAMLFERKMPGLKVIDAGVRNVAAQRNLGAKKSVGKWLVFFDADLTIPENFLSHLHHKIIKNKEVKFFTTWMGPDSQKKSDAALTMITNLIIEGASMTDKPMVSGACMIVKKEVFRKIGGFRPALKTAEDHDLAQRLKSIGVNVMICRDLKITISLRRFRREGKLEVLGKYALAMKAMLFEGPVYRELFDYPMGGKVYGKKKKAGLLKKILS